MNPRRFAMRKFWTLTLSILLMTVGLFHAGCALRAPFMQYSFDETARLKKESTALIAQSNRPYKLQSDKAKALRESVERAYQDASLRSKNQESMRVWENLLDTSQTSLAGALYRWRIYDTLPETDRVVFQKTVARDFDDISKLEGNKGR